MLFSPKVEVIPWRRTAAAEVAVSQTSFPLAWTVGTAVTATVAILPLTVQAAIKAAPAFSMGDRIIRAFNPLIELAQAAAYPVCFLMVSGGFLMWMTGNRERGLQMIKNAAIGYIGLQFAPAIMMILVEVGRAMMSSN